MSLRQLLNAAAGEASLWSPLGLWRRFASNTLDRLVANETHEWINVKDSPYNAQGDNDTDDTVAIRSAALAAAALGKTLFFPPGIYRISSTIDVPDGAGLVHWLGDHPRSAIIDWYGGASPMIIFGTDTHPVFEAVKLDNHGAATMGVYSLSYHSVFRDLYWLPTIKFSVCHVKSRDEPGPFAVEFWAFHECYFGANVGQITPIGVLLVEGNMFSFDGCVFDSPKTGIQAGTVDPQDLIRGLAITDCLFQNFTDGDDAIGVDLQQVAGFEIAACDFSFSPGISPAHLGVKIRAAVGGKIHSSYFHGGGQQLYGIECADANAHAIDIENNTMQSVVVALCHITAGTGINWDNNYSFTIGTKQAVQTNASFAPGVSFGGSTTGVTYNSVGSFRRLGDLCYVQGTVSMTSKGIAVGVARLTGLPFISTDVVNLLGPMTVAMDGLNGVTGGQYGWINTSTNSILLFVTATGSAVQLTDANFGNTSSIFFSGWYKVKDP